MYTTLGINIKRWRGQRIQLVISGCLSVVSLNPIKGSCSFLEHETLSSLLSINNTKTIYLTFSQVVLLKNSFDNTHNILPISNVHNILPISNVHNI